MKITRGIVFGRETHETAGRVGFPAEDKPECDLHQFARSRVLFAIYHTPQINQNNPFSPKAFFPAAQITANCTQDSMR